MKRKTVIIIAGLALAVSAAAYMATRPEKAAWTTPVRQDYVQSVLASGEIAADESLTVISEAAGKLTKVGFEEGGQIEASNIMAELDSQELQNSINEKTAALSAAQSNYNAVVTTNYQVAVQEVNKFKKELGFDVCSFIMRCKLEEAKSLLTYSDKTLSEISNYLCFSSQAYFQTVFKKKYGLTPTQYRNQTHKIY